MVTLVSNGDQYGIKTYYVDTELELADIPHYVFAGSAAKVLATDTNYIKDGNGDWVVAGNIGSGGLNSLNTYIGDGGEV